jgi:hypothetical protein
MRHDSKFVGGSETKLGGLDTTGWGYPDKTWGFRDNPELEKPNLINGLGGLLRVEYL